jgi:hypothetical protein
VFINVCDHEEVPVSDKKKGNKKWPLMVLGGLFRETVDKAAESCLVLDVIVNPSVTQECGLDKSGETKEEVCVRVIDALRAREKERHPEGPPGGALDKTFSLPKLSKVTSLFVTASPLQHYKGDSVASMDIPATIALDKRHQNIFEVVCGLLSLSSFTSPGRQGAVTRGAQRARSDGHFPTSQRRGLWLRRGRARQTSKFLRRRGQCTS